MTSAYPSSTSLLRLCLGVLIYFAGSIASLHGQLHISEIQASNVSSFMHSDGNYREWVELYNAGSSGIDLQGYYLSCDLQDHEQHRIGDVWIGAGDYIRIWINKDLYGPGKRLRLHMEGGELGLFSPGGILLDALQFPQQYLETSYGKVPGQADSWAYYPQPTPREPNEGFRMVIPQFAGEVEFSLEAGIYQGNQVLHMSTASGEAEIRFTTDGSWPTEQASRYTAPLSISGNVVVRAIAFRENMLPGPVATRSYLINEHSSIPIVSLSTDKDHFYHYRNGFYTRGSNGIDGNCMEEPVNWNQDWERPANMEYFTPDGKQVLNQLTGLKVHGGCSRTKPNKSIAVIARKKYGDNSLSHRFFHSKEVDEFKAIVLRNSGNDVHSSMMRDGFMQSLLIGQLDLDYQGYQPAHVFLNGSYFGIFNVREKINEHYPASNYGLDSEDIDMLEKEEYSLSGQSISGYGEHYQELLDFVEANDLSVEENYAHVCAQMDVEEYMNYFLVEIYFENEDWPKNNIKYWRHRVEGGKWRWILFDTDFGWGLLPKSGNTLEHALSAGLSSALINGLLENEGFRNEFVQRMAAMINVVFEPERVALVFDSLLQQLEPEIDRHIARWERPSRVVFDHHTQVKIPEYTENRPQTVRNQFRSHFKMSGMFDLRANVNDPGQGRIRAAGMALPDQFEGAFYMNTPLRLQAEASEGYTFSHWEGASSSTSSQLFLTSSASTSIRAVFVPVQPITGLHINEVHPSNAGILLDESGQPEDWLELHNSTDREVSLSGLYLSDSAAWPEKFRIPTSADGSTTIGAGEFLLIWCDNDSSQGPLHTNFKLKKEGESLSLVQRIHDELHVIDQLNYPPVHKGVSFGRVEESDSLSLMKPSPRSSNLKESRSTLLINEFLTSNCGLVLDEYQEADDWIELYNAGPDTMDLEGLFLTDSLGDPMKHQIPMASGLSRIPPGEHVLLWADKQEAQGALHLDFRLDAKEEQLGLYQLGHGYLDSLSYTFHQKGSACGRLSDGSGSFGFLSPTPGEPNHLFQPEGVYINEFMARNHSTPTGLPDGMPDWIEVYNANDHEVDLAGMYVSDSLGHPTKYQIPHCMPEHTVIPPQGFLLLWADDSTELGPLHLNFKLSGAGESISLVAEDGLSYLDSLSYREVLKDMALGRFPDASPHWGVVRATPGQPNFGANPGILVISEFSASGNHSHSDEHGEFDDWIEIYNPNDVEVDLGGLYLSDSLGELDKYRIPTSHPDSTRIGPKSYLVLWADGQPEQGILHLDFRLSGRGEALCLTDMDGHQLLDSLSYPEQHSHFTYGRLPDSGQWSFLRPTPLAPNTLLSISGLRINEFMASNTSIPDEHGDLDDWIELYNANPYPVDLGGLYLSDTSGDLTRFRIPSHSPELTTMEAGSHMLIYADNSKEQGVLHAGFKLSSQGEQILLTHYDGTTVLDSLSYAGQYRNSATGLAPESGHWLCLPPTPGAPNAVPPIHGIVINEFMASNKSLPDEFGEFDDWIEVHNTNDFPVDLGGLYLSDSLGTGDLSRIPSDTASLTTIAAGGFLVFYADGDPEQGALHTRFKLSSKGESIVLRSYDLSILDSLSFGEQYTGASYALLKEAPRWLHLPPTLGAPNLIPQLSGLRINEFMASNSSIQDEFGEFEDWIELHNTNDYPVDLGGLYLSDSLGQTDRYRIPSDSSELTTIPAGGFLLVYADSDSRQGPLHTNFKLSSDGEEIVLSSYDPAILLDSLSYSKQHRNAACALLTSPRRWLSLPPTPNAENACPDYSKVYITEFMAHNATYPDENGLASDWIELHNANDFPIDLGGLYLSDSLGKLDKYRIPSDSTELTTLGPGGYLLFRADDAPELGPLHTSFKLRSAGEAIALVHPDTETILDSVSFGQQYKNASSSYWEESAEWHWLPPTPGSANAYPDYQALVINEVMGYNRTILTDSHNEYDDWIEIHNTGEERIDIGGMYVSDSLDHPEKSRISSAFPDSTTLAPGGYMLLWADNSRAQGVCHLGFRISKTGETLGLFDPNRALVDSITYPFISPNLSWGRKYDGDDQWIVFSGPTPSSPNLYTSTGHGPKDAHLLAIYPNPAVDLVHFELGMDQPGELILEVIDSKGMRCVQYQDYHPGGGRWTFSWSPASSAGGHLEKGLYFCRIHAGGKVYSGKFILR